MVGWAYWEFKKYNDVTTTAGSTSEGFYENDGSLQAKKVKALARTYLKVTQGTPISFNFDSSSGKYVAKYTANSAIKGPSVIFASTEYYYPNGLNVKVEDPNGYSLAQDSLSILI